MQDPYTGKEAVAVKTGGPVTLRISKTGGEWGQWWRVTADGLGDDEYVDHSLKETAVYRFLLERGERIGVEVDEP